MKTRFFLLTTMVVFALSFTACDDDPTPTPPGKTTEGFINAASETKWVYYSFAKNDTIGSAEGNEANDAAWAKRKDWDIAVRRMYIRTNSGTSTTVGANGGVFTFDINNKDKVGNVIVTTSFASVQNVPDTAVFALDKVVTYAAMSGNVTTSQSNTVVTAMQKKWNDKTKKTETIMPPIYMKSPVSIFRSADGKNYYKVEFTQYVDENNKKGQDKFNFSQIYKN